jgi:hypothetical protein
VTDLFLCKGARTDVDVDLSSFPLLRIDQVCRHSTDSERQIIELKAIASLAPFVSKLLA